MFRILLLLPALAAIFAYLPSLSYGFSQDDFINLYISRVSNLADFLNFFNPFAHFPDLFFYRPLPTQVWYFANYSLFGLNPLPFHIESLIFHIANSYLIYLAAIMLFKKKNLAILASVLYALSAVHFISLYYISTFQEVLKTFFILLGVVSFSKNKYISYFSFIFALLCKESAVIFPAYLIVFELFRRRAESWFLVFRETFIRLIPMFIIVLGYVLLRLPGIQGVLHEGGYSMNFSPMNIIQNIKWYFIWTFGLPEILATYPNLKPEGVMQFMRDFGLSIGVVVSFIILLSTVFLSLIRKINIDLKSVLLLFFLWLVPLIPALALNGHKYPQYLGLSLLPVLSVFYLILINNKFKWLTLSVGLISFVVLQITSLELTKQTHWTTHRSEVSSYYFNSFKKDYPDMEEGTTIVFSGTYGSLNELSVTLAKDYGLKVLFNGRVEDVRYLYYDTAEEVGKTLNKSIIKKIDFF